MRTVARRAVGVDRLDALPVRMIGRHSMQEQVGATGDHGQEIVEVVRDSARELSDRFHLLELAGLHLAVVQRRIHPLPVDPPRDVARRQAERAELGRLDRARGKRTRDPEHSSLGDEGVRHERHESPIRQGIGDIGLPGGKDPVQLALRHGEPGRRLIRQAIRLGARPQLQRVIVADQPDADQGEIEVSDHRIDAHLKEVLERTRRAQRRGDLAAQGERVELPAELACHVVEGGGHVGELIATWSPRPACPGRPWPAVALPPSVEPAGSGFDGSAVRSGERRSRSSARRPA